VPDELLAAHEAVQVLVRALLDGLVAVAAVHEVAGPVAYGQDKVVAGAGVEVVRAGAAVDVVAPPAAVDGTVLQAVVARAAVRVIVSRFAVEPVGAAVTVEPVVAVQAPRRMSPPPPPRVVSAPFVPLRASPAAVPPSVAAKAAPVERTTIIATAATTRTSPNHTPDARAFRSLPPASPVAVIGTLGGHITRYLRLIPDTVVAPFGNGSGPWGIPTRGVVETPCRGVSTV
jgi:hypothetical protein